MNIKRISLVTTIIILFSVILVGCSSSPDKVIADAIKKNKEIAYSKQDINMNISVAGIGGDIKIAGETDAKAKKTVMKATLSAPAMNINNMAFDIYMDNNVLYVKDPEAGTYMKINANEASGETSQISSTLAGEMLTVLKDDKTLKESIKMTNGENSDKVISANVSSETVSKLLDKALASESAISTMESAVQQEFIAAAEAGGQTITEEITAAAKTEAKTAVEEYKKALKEIKFENIKYTGKVNKDGYLYAENLSVDIKEATTGVTVNIKIDFKLSDINTGKTVTIPEIPKDKIVEMK